jgi:hypothetical protein
MANDYYIHIRTGPDYETVVQQDGVRTTVCENRYEILVQPTGTVPEQNAIQQFRDWIRARNAKDMQGVGCVSE